MLTHAEIQLKIPIPFSSNPFYLPVHHHHHCLDLINDLKPHYAWTSRLLCAFQGHSLYSFEGVLLMLYPLKVDLLFLTNSRDMQKKFWDLVHKSHHCGTYSAYLHPAHKEQKSVESLFLSSWKNVKHLNLRSVDWWLPWKIKFHSACLLSSQCCDFYFYYIIVETLFYMKAAYFLVVENI